MFYDKAVTASRLGANLTVVVGSNTDTLVGMGETMCMN